MPPERRHIYWQHFCRAALVLVASLSGCTVLDQRQLSGGPVETGSGCASAAACAPTGYRFSAPPSTNGGSVRYYDELHDENVSGDPLDPSGFAELAQGQLLDGVRGMDSPFNDLGHGEAYEWVAWNPAAMETVSVTFAFSEARPFSTVRVGTTNLKPPGSSSQRSSRSRSPMTTRPTRGSGHFERVPER
jgi:Discoidin domain-containing receptor 1/2, DS-like domain